jgi:hypothetical protein
LLIVDGILTTENLSRKILMQEWITRFLVGSDFFAWVIETLPTGSPLTGLTPLESRGSRCKQIVIYLKQIRARPLKRYGRSPYGASSSPI